MYQSHPHPKLRQYSDLAEGWKVDKKLIIDWFRQRQEAKLDPEKSDGKDEATPSMRTSGVTVSKSLIKSNSKSLVRRTRSFEKVILTREQRWLLEAAVEKASKTPLVIISTIYSLLYDKAQFCSSNFMKTKQNTIEKNSKIPSHLNQLLCIHTNTN